MNIEVQAEVLQAYVLTDYTRTKHQDIDRRWMSRSEQQERQKSEGRFRVWERQEGDQSRYSIPFLVRALCSYRVASNLDRFSRAVDPEGRHSPAYLEKLYFGYWRLSEHLGQIAAEILEAIIQDYCRLLDEEAQSDVKVDVPSLTTGGGVEGKAEEANLEPEA